MRIFLCFRREGAIYRLVWVNEDKGGIYLGYLGGQAEAHWSYHRDGRSHTKIGSDYYNQADGIPIENWRGVRQLSNTFMPMTDNWFSSATRYSEGQLFDLVGRHLASDPGYTMVAEVVAALDHFPDHKIAVTVRAGMRDQRNT